MLTDLIIHGILFIWQTKYTKQKKVSSIGNSDKNCIDDKNNDSWIRRKIRMPPLGTYNTETHFINKKYGGLLSWFYSNIFFNSEVCCNYIDAFNILLIYEKIRICAKDVKRKKKLREGLIDNGESFHLLTYLSLQNK